MFVCRLRSLEYLILIHFDSVVLRHSVVYFHFCAVFWRYRVLNGGTQRHVSPVNLWIFFCSNFKFKILLIHFFRLFPRLAPVFNCPLIWSSSMDPHTFVLSLIHEHLNPSYVVDHMSLDYSFSFWHRVNQLWTVSRVIYYKW